METGAYIVLSGLQLVLAGIGIGVLVAAPIGPVNVLCIQRAASRGFWGGVAAGLGAVLGDGLLAAIAAFSMTAISDAMEAYTGVIQLVGGVVLIGFGIALAVAKPVMAIPAGQKSGLAAHTSIIPQTFFLTITNPGAILGMAAIIGGFGSLMGGLDTYVEALVLVVSIMVGSLLWWLGLSELITTIRHRLTERRLLMINWGAGALLVVCGGILVIDLIWQYVR